MKPKFQGDSATDAATLDAYSRDVSVFKIVPCAVHYPVNVEDIVALVHDCLEEKKTRNPNISLTVRAGGTCMSGGGINDGWIVDLTRHMKKISVDAKARTATVEMGAFFRDVESAAAEHGLMFAAYPSSHKIAGIGGMVGNNASGEKSLRFGATSDNVLELEVVLGDGTVHTVRPHDVSEMTDTTEAALLNLYTIFGERMKHATGSVKKSASGYRLEKVLEGNTFNAVPVFVGAQGTLGIVTRAVLKLVPIPEHLELLLISAKSLQDLPDIVHAVLEHNPEGLETFDKHTWEKAKQYMEPYAKRVKSFVAPNANLFILAQFSESTREATEAQAAACLLKLSKLTCHAAHVTNPDDIEAAWQIRRNSFLLMRDYNEEGERAVPCIEDVIVPLPMLGIFIEKLDAILVRHKLSYGFHGHIGDGSLRVIPVFDFTKPGVAGEIIALMEDVFALVKEVDGNISADHSDGIIRTPFLESFYSPELYAVFASIKGIFDPYNIMNPNKKVGGTVEMIERYLDR